MSLLVSVVVVLLAYPLAYYLALSGTRRKYVLLLILIAPFLTSYLLRVLAWKVILGSQGVINTFFFWTGLRAEGHPLSFLLYSRFAVVLVLVYVWLPFVGLPLFLPLLRVADARPTGWPSPSPPTHGVSCPSPSRSCSSSSTRRSPSSSSSRSTRRSCLRSRSAASRCAGTASSSTTAACGRPSRRARSRPPCRASSLSRSGSSPPSRSRGAASSGRASSPLCCGAPS